MPVRSARLAFASSGIGGVVIVYTCPAGKTALIKDVRISALNGAVTRASVFADSGPRRVAIIDEALANLGVLSRQGFMVLEPGDTLGCFATGSDFHIWASGAELEGLAP